MLIQMVSGIYAIKHTPTNRHYVGSAINIKARWSCHLHDLKNNKHSSRFLQDAWNKHGQDEFNFILLELVPEKDNLTERERYWIDHFQSDTYGFNTNILAYRKEVNPMIEDNTVQLTVRIPKPLMDQIKFRAMLMRRSRNSEILSMLEAMIAHQNERDLKAMPDQSPPETKSP